MKIRIISTEELELLLKGKNIPVMYSESWLSIVRMLPCMYPHCGVQRAGTAHHLFGRGMALVCSDYLTMPLCINHHVLNNGSVQEMTDDEFEAVFSMTKSDMARRVYKLIVEMLMKGKLW